MSKKSEGATGSVLGSILRFIFVGLQLFFKIIFRLLWFLGLWIPGVYIIFGVALHYIFGFNPLDWELEGQLYFSGLIACAVCSIVITIRNIIIKPVKSVYKGYKKPVWKKEKEQQPIKKEEIKIPNKDIAKEETEKTRPSIYYSTIEENTLIHEFEDRFEIYRIEDNKAKLERVEYK